MVSRQLQSRPSSLEIYNARTNECWWPFKSLFMHLEIIIQTCFQHKPFTFAHGWRLLITRGHYQPMQSSLRCFSFNANLAWRQLHKQSRGVRKPTLFCFTHWPISASWTPTGMNVQIRLYIIITIVKDFAKTLSGLLPQSHMISSRLRAVCPTVSESS